MTDINLNSYTSPDPIDSSPLLYNKFNIGPTISGKNITFRTGASTTYETIRFTQDNRVGIGMTDPSEKLSISGNLNLLTDNTYKINNTPVLSNNTLGSGVVSSSLTSLGTLSSLTVNNTITANGIDNNSTLNLGNNSTTINMGTNTASTINIGTGSSVSTINIGGVGDTVNIIGTLNYIQSTNLQVADKLITLNKGTSGSGTARLAGIEIRDNNLDNTAYIRTTSNGTAFELKAPENSFVLTSPVLSQNSIIVASDSNGNIGVGRTPSFSVDVSGRVIARNNTGVYTFTALNSAETISLNLSAGTVGSYPNATFLQSIGSDLYINYGGNNTLINANGSGNVGINITNPSYKLDVNGYARLLPMSSSIGAAIMLDAYNGLGAGVGRVFSIASTLGANASGYGKLQFHDETLNMTRMVIDSNGNVGIGVTDPSNKLQINEGNIVCNATNNNYLIVKATGSSYGFSIYHNTNDMGLYSTENKPVYISIAGIHKFYIATSSNVGLSTTNPGYRLDVQGGDINASGSIRSNGTALTSDIRIKTNIELIDDGESLSKLRLIEPKKYNYRDPLRITEDKVYGFMAQEVRQILPDAVELKTNYLPNIIKPAILYKNTIIFEEPVDIDISSNILIKQSNMLDILGEFVVITKMADTKYKLERYYDMSGNQYDVFVYGTKVNDFHFLKKDALFTLNFAATQELDRKVQVLENKEVYFTGQHFCYIDNIEPQDINYYIGRIVVSNGEYIEFDNSGNIISGKYVIAINKAIPKLVLSQEFKQRSVFGVISNTINYNNLRTVINNNKIAINSIGEGAMWVISELDISSNPVNIIKNGDYITSSDIAGYGIVQDDDILHNYTVAKTTCECNFELGINAYECEQFLESGKLYRKAFIGVTYHCA